jgi:tetratricopeptide (TPR) repeat protein
MEHRTKRDHSLINLVSNFEDMSQKGIFTYLDEKSIYQLISYYENENLVDKALEVVDFAIEQYRYRSEFYTVKARLLLQSHQSETALQLLKKAETIAPFEIEVRVLQAKALSDLEQFDEALLIVDELKSSATQGDLAEIHLCESHIHENMNDYDAMFKSLRQVLLLEPFNEEALERMWISVELSKNYTESIQFHEKLINIDPYSYLAWFNLGHAQACVGEYEKAIVSLEYSFLICEGFEIAYYDCAELCCQIRKYNKAISLYKEANRLFGPDCELLVSIAECYIKLNKIEEAKAQLHEAMNLDPYNDEIFYNLAECYTRDKKWVKAIKCYKKAIEIEDRREEYFSGLAFAYVEIAELDKAEHYFQKSTEVAPEESLYWLQFVSFLMKSDNIEKALNVLDDAENCTFSPGLIYCRATCLLILNKRKEAFKVLEEALVENFEMHKVIFELGPQFSDDSEVHSIINYFKGEVQQDIS